MSGPPAPSILAITGLLLASILLGPARANTSGQQLAQSAGHAMIGSPAPRLTLTTIDGETIDLDGLYGKKAVYLKFWATWCVPCRQQMPHFEHVFETAGPDLAVVAIDVGLGDSLDAIRRARTQLGMTMPIVFDEDGHIGAAFHLRVTPQHVIIGRDGRIQYVGHLTDQRLDAALSAATSPGGAAGDHGLEGKRAQSDSRSVTVGDPLPAKSVPLLDGRSFRLQQSGSGRPSVLVFLSPWCESYLATTRPKVSEACRSVREQVTALADGTRVRWLGIASGLWATRDDLRRYRKNYKVAIPLTLDASGNLFREFRVNEVPTIILVDAEGKIVQRVDPAESRSLKDALERLH